LAFCKQLFFENHILPILLSSCAYSGCHDKVTKKEGIILTDYSALIKSDIIKKGNAQESELFEVITDEDKDRMPPLPKAALTSNEINLIEKWINQGAKNNKCNSCDTNNVKFSTVVSQIISSNCKGCHSGSNPSKNVKLENYNDVKAIADDGRLLNVINSSVYALMPPSGKLDNCKINQITKWVNAGAPNN